MVTTRPTRPKSALTERRSAATDRTGATRCSRCGAVLVCGALAGTEHCWCMELPPLPATNHTANATAGCLCRACLEQELADSASRG